MSRNSCSPFFQEVPLCLSDITRVVSDQIYEYKKASELENCLIIDCSQFDDLNINETVCNMANHIGACIKDEELVSIAEFRSRKNAADYCKNISKVSMTSLKHDFNTFFHLDHVTKFDVGIEEYMDKEWINYLLDKFSDTIDEHGNLH